MDRAPHDARATGRRYVQDHYAARKTFDVLAKGIGQVFGVALDDATPPNIYVAATSVFGLQIVGRGRDGLPERRNKGQNV